MKCQPVAHLGKRIEGLRIPAVGVLPDDIYHMLHHSFVRIVKMRRSIERANFHLAQSNKAVGESLEILARLKKEHF